MRHWTFWEWLAYACLLVGAVIIAADTGIRLSPDLATRLPYFFHGPVWGFAPAILVILATLVLLYREFSPLNSSVVAAPRTSIPKGLEWHSGYEVFKLATPALFERHKVARAELEAVRAQFTPLFERLRKTDNPVEITEIEKARDDLAKIDKEKERKSESLWTQCWDDIRQRLCSGELIATGFKKPVAQNPDAVLIPSEYWRFLRFADSYEAAQGEGIGYTGVVVARAK